MLKWDWYGFDKKRFRTRYVEHVFFHPVGSEGHVMHSSVSKARIVDTLFFMLGWHRYGFYKNHTGTRYAKLVVWHLVAYVGHTVHCSASEARKIDNIFHAQVGPVRI
jgi:hypothetical protein